MGYGYDSSGYDYGAGSAGADTGAGYDFSGGGGDWSAPPDAAPAKDPFFGNLGKDLLGGILKTGTALGSQFATRALFGDDAARTAARQAELDKWGRLNGAGPADRAGAARDAALGQPQSRNPFAGALSGGWQTLALVGVAVLLGVLVIRRL